MKELVLALVGFHCIVHTATEPNTEQITTCSIIQSCDHLFTATLQCFVVYFRLLPHYSRRANSLLAKAQSSKPLSCQVNLPSPPLADTLFPLLQQPAHVSTPPILHAANLHRPCRQSCQSQCTSCLLHKSVRPRFEPCMNCTP